MNRRCFWHLVAGGLVVASVYPVGRAAGQTTTAGVAGRTTFEVYCASCHGTSAKGDGPLASSMKQRPADLTEIAKRNGGTFPGEQVAQIIDGRKPVKGHGGGNMPVWGDAFAKSSDPSPVEEKIQRLVSYLQSIQVKP